MFGEYLSDSYDIDWSTLLTFIVLSGAYFGAAVWAALRLGSSFDERYKVITAIAAAYLVVLGGWRFLDQRARDVAHDVVVHNESLCADTVRAASELTSAYQAKLNAEPLTSKDVSGAAGDFLKQYPEASAIDNQKVSNAVERFFNVADHDNWGRNLTGQQNHSEDSNKISLRYSCLEDATEGLAKACSNMMRSVGIITMHTSRAQQGGGDPAKDICLTK